MHYFIDAESWDDYFPEGETENPLPETYDPQKRPVSLERGGPWQYVETDWAALDVTDEEFGGDGPLGNRMRSRNSAISSSAIERLKPLFPRLSRT